MSDWMTGEAAAEELGWTIAQVDQAAASGAIAAHYAGSAKSAAAMSIEE